MKNETIPRAEAIARMAKGEPVETREERGVEWNPTMWRDFELLHPEFRIPPEPRREAREFWIEARRDGPDYAWGNRCTAPNAIHVREVLPDEVWIGKMTEDEASRWIDKNACNRMDVIRALGLLKDDAS